MAGTARIEVVGLKRLRASMRAAGLDMRDLRDLNKRAAGVAAPWVRARTPIGPPAGGHIRATVRAGGSGSAGVIRVGGKSRPYAGVVHYGWPARNIRPNTWVVDAAKHSERAWTQVYIRGIEDILGRIEGA